MWISKFHIDVLSLKWEKFFWIGFKFVDNQPVFDCFLEYEGNPLSVLDFLYLLFDVYLGCESSLLERSHFLPLFYTLFLQLMHTALPPKHQGRILPLLNDWPWLTLLIWKKKGMGQGTALWFSAMMRRTICSDFCCVVPAPGRFEDLGFGLGRAGVLGRWGASFTINHKWLLINSMKAHHMFLFRIRELRITSEKCFVMVLWLSTYLIIWM